MSFITREELESWRHGPELVDWLAGKQWHGFFRGSWRKRGEEYARWGRVLSILPGPDFHGCCEILATVEGSRPRPYEVELAFPSFGGGRSLTFQIDAACTCPVGMFCKHTAAVLARLREIITSPPQAPADPAVPTPAFDRWVENLRAAAKPAKKRAKAPSNSYLAYCLERDWSGEVTLQLRRATEGKRGVRIHEGNARADPSNPASYITEEEYPLIMLFHRLAPERWNPAARVEGPEAARILLGALERGALFCDRGQPEADAYGRTEHDYQRLRRGADLVAVPAWKTTEDGSAQPVVDLRDPEGREAAPGAMILPTAPPLYVDSGSGCLGEVRSAVSAAMLQQWSCGPPLKPEQLPVASDVLDTLGGALPPPVQSERIELPRARLRPHLRIRLAGLAMHDDEFIVGELRFRYGEGPLLPPLGAGETPRHVWREDGKQFVRERDAKAEARRTRELERAGVGLPALSEEDSGMVLPRDLDSPLMLAWLRFLDVEAPPLRKKGWTIEADPDAGLSIFEAHDFQAHLEADTDHGIDWFHLDPHVDADGQRVSLIPAVADLIGAGVLDEGVLELPDEILIPVPPPGSGFVKIRSERIVELCRSIAHLLHGREPGDGPLKIDRLTAAGLADDLKLDESETVRALASLGRRLRDIKGLPEVDPPTDLRADLRPYQIDGYRWLRFLSEHQLQGILADDMGLGKTVQALAYLAATSAKAALPSLVVAPTSVVGNWAAEAERFVPGMKVVVWHGQERHDRIAEVPGAGIVVTSYALLARDREQLVEQEWAAVILDEAQYIKNAKTAASKAACALKASHRFCLTGTPIENHLGELWSLMRFLMPGFLGDEKTFNRSIRRPIERDRDPRAQLALNRRVSPLILRRTKDEVAADLPRKTEIVHRIDLSPRELDLYESVRSLMDRRVRDAIQARGLGKSHIIVLDALLKLRQVCCHPSLLKTPAAQKVKEASKFGFLTRDLLPTLIEEGRRILLFSSFTSVLSLIEKDLREAGVPFLKLTGRTRNRRALVEAFQEGEAPVFLISLKAGGTGLNLTAADTVIHYDPWWNPAAENQATDRAHRIGQTRPVFVHKLICRGGIEDRILDLQAHKARLVEALFTEETSKIRIDQETLSQLLAPVEAGPSPGTSHKSPTTNNR